MSNQECDDRFTDYGTDYAPTTYDPRCRVWYQDAAESSSGKPIFTNPYVGASSGRLDVTVAAPVFDSTNPTLLLGVVGLDMDFTDVESSINGLKVIGHDGYAYLLAPGGTGEVAVHYNLGAYDGTQYIIDLESGVDDKEFGDLVARMSDECTGSEKYSKDGGTWVLSWKHETVSGSGAYDSDGCGDNGFIAVVTVSESVLLKVGAP